MRPSNINLSGDGSNIVYGLTWAAWDGKGATGNGTVDWEDCNPNCAGGSHTPTPVRIYLNDPVNGVFSLLTEEVKGQTPFDIQVPTRPGQMEGNSTTTPPTTTTTSLPAVDTNPYPGGPFTLEVRPSDIDISGLGSNNVMNITWLAWDNHGATGHGTVADTPNSTSPVTIYLNDPVNGVFSLLTEETPGQPNSGQNFSLPIAPGQQEGSPTPSAP